MRTPSDALQWCLLPDFELQSTRQRRPRSLRSSLRPLLRPAARRPFTAGSHAAAGDILIVTRAENERRVLTPVLGEGVTLETPTALLAALGDAAAKRARPTLRWVDELARRIGRTDLRDQWRAMTVATERHRMAYAQMDLSVYRCVLVPRQSHPFVRALIHESRAQRVPVAYIPHSPLTFWQIDLPVDHAGLRGPAERDYVVAATGADSERISVIGNPATDLLSADLPQLDERLPGVLALGATSESRNLHLIESTIAAGIEHVVVAPHPRSDMRALRKALPRSWAVHEGTTVDLLRQGPPWLLQSQSGIVTDAAALGIPTAEVTLEDEPRVYPFLGADSICHVASPNEIRYFTETARTSDRARLRETLRAWVACDGEDARSRARDFLAAITPADAGPPIMDAWAPGGALHRTSVLAAL